ncbi:MAG: LLM class flavin-dependent oxidoreductase [Anaerolineales bacterium]|nr:LLM class flavin-dependent oxidoreductase [Anaerolineales bacterium]
MSVDFGLVLPAGPRKDHINQWLDNLEEVLPSLTGHFKSLWMTDHFMRGETPVYEAWTVLSYAAARWPQFDLGPIVLGQSYRNPAMLAKMGATLQHLSRGRLIMALGAGWKADEYLAYGYPFPSSKTRLEQLEEAVIIVKRLWTEPGPVSFQGQYYHVSDAYCEPKPDPVPTLLIGGGGRTTIGLAARYADWWNLPDANFEKLQSRLPIIQEQCDRVGRDPASLRLTWFGRLAVARSEAEALALSNGKWTKERALVGTPEQVVAEMQRFIEAGVDYFMIEVLGLSITETRAMVLEEVLPVFSG